MDAMTASGASRRRERTARLDLRLSPANRDLIAVAARANDTTVVDYVLSAVLPVARRDVAESRTTYLSRDAWDDFLAMLDAPDTPQTAALRERATRWDSTGPAPR